ncbi:TetR/AcrR family transcriptional regulator [Rhodococcus jostii]|uniref:TetR/AcrR family transcriptional regulator n=1 Tax=Rhodococcus jostii TaxID=132919 RepID=UPI0036452CCE
MPERREQIADAVITIIAREGIRALTHRAVDRALDLPGGSTSYYFRTRRALIESAVRRLAERSRQEFETTAAPPLDLASLAEGVARSLDRLLYTRHDDVAARHALTVELSGDAELHALLATCLFSRARATELFDALGVADPESAGADFVSVVEGLVFDRFAGARSLDGIEPGTERSVRQLARAVESYLRGVTA